MRQMIAFTKKEILHQFRSGRAAILCALFALLGVMNVAVAKLTPLLLEMVGNDLSMGGLVIEVVPATALDAWAQFFKNMPIALVIFVIMFSSHLTEEYQKGTLINMLTKGLKRPCVMASKMLVALVLWTVGYALCFGVTCAASAYFWDISTLHHTAFAAMTYYVMGLWLISLIYTASAFLNSFVMVMLTVGGGFLLSYLFGLVPKINVWGPAYLSGSSALLVEQAVPGDYIKALIVTGLLIVVNVTAAILGFNKKQV